MARIAAIALLLASAANGSQAAWIGAKAIVAQHLLDKAWTRSLAHPSARAERPWPWADISPALKLEIPSIDRSIVVLDNASGEALAFGPGLVAGDPLHADQSALVLGGHRDTHLSFLEHIEHDEEFRVVAPDGGTFTYSATHARIVDTRHESLAIESDAPGLVLITCWPFNAGQTGGPLRYVVEARLTLDSTNP